jgi:two-component system, LytTR family, sensor kinase
MNLGDLGVCPRIISNYFSPFTGKNGRFIRFPVTYNRRPSRIAQSGQDRMTTSTAASLVNLLGFITGIVLYVMLLWMVLTSRPESNRLALLTGLLGFAWNVGAFGGYGLFDLGFSEPAPLVLAAAFSSLCFLPAVVVHSALDTAEKLTRLQYGIVATLAYALSGAATVANFYSAVTTGAVPSQSAMRGVTIGFGILLIALLVVTRGHQKRGPVLWVVAMSVFAVSALHLSTNHAPGEDPWWLQLAGHHASLPLALLILYQDFRFALADIFLKRALAFILLAGLIFGIFVFAVTPLTAANPTSERSTAILLALWVSTALAYPLLRRGAALFVDKIVLTRVDYEELASTLSRALDRCETPEAALDETARTLAPAISAKSIGWSQSNDAAAPRWVRQDRRSARVTVLTADKPHYVLAIGELSGGRRLFSDDIAMLEHAALLAARRIDAVRSSQERYRRDIEAQEMQKLAAEAELRALRAQVNPHFLFNALTTIGYLIQTTPERALGTLMRLSGLLRGVLRASDEFVTIGEELDLIEAYLDIERARFEDRLRVRIDVPWELRRIRIPALVIQPLVENAIKHGISECLAGGEVRISVRLLEKEALISVVDTGLGVTESTLERRKRRGGLGLSNVEQRLRRYGNIETPLVIRSTPGVGTTVEVRIPIQASEMASLAGTTRSS